MAENVLMLQRGTPPRTTRDLLARLAAQLGFLETLEGITVDTVKHTTMHIPRTTARNGAGLCGNWPGNSYEVGHRSFAQYSRGGGCVDCLASLPSQEGSGLHVATALTRLQRRAAVLLSVVAGAHALATLPSQFTVGVLSSRRHSLRHTRTELQRDLDALEVTSEADEAHATWLRAGVETVAALHDELAARLADPAVDLAIRRRVCEEMLGEATPDSLTGLDDAPTIVGVSRNMWFAGRVTDLIRDRYGLAAEHSVLLEVPRFVADYLLVTSDVKAIRRSSGRLAVPQTAPAGWSAEELTLAGALFDPGASSSMRSLAHALDSARSVLSV